MQNKPGSQDYTVINTLGNLYPLVYLSPESFILKNCSEASKYTKKLNLWCIQHNGVEIPRCIHHQEEETPQCIHDSGVKISQCFHSSPESHFGHQGVVSPGESFHREVIFDTCESFYGYLGAYNNLYRDFHSKNCLFITLTT